MHSRGLRIAIVYTIVSVCYIFASDALLAELEVRFSLENTIVISAVKGALFVIVSGVLIAWLLQRSEKRAEASEKSTMDLFRQHPDPMWVLDVESFDLLDVNQAALDLYGYDGAEFLGMNSDALRPVEELERHRDHVTQIREKPVVRSGLWRHRTKSGQPIWANIRSSAVTYRGREARLIAASDVTKMMDDWAEYPTVDPTIYKALKRLKLVADSIQDGFIFLNQDLEVIQTNPTFCSKVRLSVDELIGTSIYAVSPWLAADMLEPVIEAIQETTTSGALDAYNEVAKEWYRIIIYPNTDGFALFLRDVTTEKAAERKMRVEHETLMSLVNNTESVVFTVDVHQHLTLFNYRFAEIVLSERLSPPIIGESPENLPVLANFLDVWNDVFASALEGQSRTVEVKSKVGANMEHFMMLRISPLMAEGKIIGAGVVMQDIHELRQSLDQLRRSNIALSEIAQVSSHELRGPLTSIMALLNMIEYSELPNDRNADILQQLSSISADVDSILHRLVHMAQKVDA